MLYTLQIGLSTPTAIIGGTILAITAIVGAVKYLNSSGERANANFAKSFESYSQAKYDAEQINSELESMKTRMTELQTKGGLTFVEKAELENLREATRLLEIQSDLAKEKAKREAKQKQLEIMCI